MPPLRSSSIWVQGTDDAVLDLLCLELATGSQFAAEADSENAYIAPCASNSVHGVAFVSRRGNQLCYALAV